MPMQWTVEADQKLFAAVMRVYDVKLSGAKLNEVAELMGPECTAKALTHKLAKVKNGSGLLPALLPTGSDTCSPDVQTITATTTPAVVAGAAAAAGKKRGATTKTSAGGGKGKGQSKGKGKGKGKGKKGDHSADEDGIDGAIIDHDDDDDDDEGAGGWGRGKRVKVEEVVDDGYMEDEDGMAEMR